MYDFARVHLQSKLATFLIEFTKRLVNHYCGSNFYTTFSSHFQHYVSTLSNQQEYDATIELVEHTAKMIEVFLDFRAINKSTDERITTLRRAHQYFQQFQGEAARESFTAETSYDVLCTLGGLIELTTRVTDVHNVTVVPANINSDIVENHFSIVRGLFNGSSDHPNYFGYLSIQNSAILTQPQLSRKRNAYIDRAYVQPPKVAKK